jgi:hypothetical protein
VILPLAKVIVHAADGSSDRELSPVEMTREEEYDRNRYVMVGDIG